MEYQEAKQKYIQAWGSLGSSWGINRTMAQIHALLLISEDPLPTNQIMEELKVSRGNANMNIRQLLDWGIAEKVLIPGERQEYFTSNKDIMALGTQVARERKKRELEPLLRVLAELKEVQGEGKEVQTFRQVTGDLYAFASQAEKVLDTFIQSNKSWFFKFLTKIGL